MEDSRNRTDRLIELADDIIQKYEQSKQYNKPNEKSNESKEDSEPQK